MWMMRAALVVACSAVLGLGCLAVDFDDGVIACGAAGCPPGLSCAANGYCYADPESDPSGPEPDGGHQASCPAAAYDPCTTIPALPADPQIDGDLDCGEMLIPISTEHWLPGSAGDAPFDHAAEVAVGWRPDGLYVYALVHEPELDPARNNEPVYQGDALELYVDDDGLFANPPYYDAAGTRQFVAAAPEWSETSRRGVVYADGYELGDWNPQSFIGVPTADGYAIEAFVRTEQLGTPERLLSAGDAIGFNLAINVSRDDVAGQQDDYLGQYFLHVATDGGSPWPFESVGAFCTPALSSP